MKTSRTSAVIVAAVVGLFAGTASAQEIVTARVPFSFVVHGEEFPAGRYEIRSDNGVLALRGMDNQGSAFALAQPAGGSDPAGDQPVLVFTRDANEYLLSQIWESSSDGLVLPQPSIAREHADAPPVSSSASTVMISAEVR